MKKLILIIAAVAALSFSMYGCANITFGSEVAGNNGEQPEKGIDYTVVYYSVNDNKQITVEEKYNGSPEFMMSYLISRISDLCGVNIDYNNISDDGDGQTVTVDFSANGYPASGLSSSSESAVLDSITETIFANYPSVNNICFTCDGKEYNSGHVSLEKGEAYRTRLNEESIDKSKGPFVDAPEFYDAQ